MISTRGRYALRVMLDLARRDPDSWVSLESIAQSQQISKKYLESIMKTLVAEGLVQGVRGKGGGYKLTSLPKDIPVGHILTCAEGGLEPVNCLKDPDYSCPRKDQCQTLPLWIKFDGVIKDFFNGMSLQDVLDGTF